MEIRTIAPAVPTAIRTARLLLRPWRAEDANLLGPVLANNWEHLGPWIPARVAEPAPEPVLARRLAGFADEFAADREWRYGMFSLDERTVLGEVALFPRDGDGRVPYADADRVEMGYWLRVDMTGQGIVTEGARALLDVVSGLAHVSHVEIRCDARNRPSAAVPQRLGFTLSMTVPVTSTAATSTDSAIELQVWTLAT